MFEMNRIGVLGSGWLGLPLARYLQNQYKRLHLSTRSTTKFSTLSSAGFNAHLIDIELLCSDELSSVDSFLQVDTLIINITCKTISAYQQLITKIEKSPIKQVLFISATSVYPDNGGLCRESDLLTIETNLRSIEKLFSNNSYFKCTVIRFAGLIGPKRHPGRFFITGKSVKDAHAKVNLIHRDDCIKLIFEVLKQQAWGEIFNACADNHPTKQAYYSVMAQSLGYATPDCFFVKNSANKIICNQKIKQQLGYQFIYPDLYQIIC